MAQTLNTKYLREGYEEYTIRNLDLPNSYELIVQELDMPQSWSNGSVFFTGDSDFTNNFKSNMNVDNVELLRKSITDNENLLKLIFDIIGYGKRKIYGYSNQALKSDLSVLGEDEEIEELINQTDMNPSPSDYEYNLKKRTGYVGYGGYGNWASKKETKKSKSPVEKHTNHKIENFITPSWVMSKYDDEDANKTEESSEWDALYNPYGTNSNAFWRYSNICDPILKEIRAFSNRNNLRRMNEHHVGFSKKGESKNIETLLKRRRFIFDNITMRHDYASDKELIKSRELLINSPLMNMGFFENMKTFQHNEREWHRWINRGLGELEDCDIPQLELPNDTPFILINYSTDLWQPWEGLANIDIYLIFNQISFKDYNLNVNKAYPKGEWHKRHLFNRGGQRGGFNLKNRNKEKRYLNDTIYLGHHIHISDHEVTTHNFFGPIETPIHPLTCREVMGEWEEENNFPMGEVFYKYKIIELKDIYKKIVNWPRTKPVKLK